MANANTGYAKNVSQFEEIVNILKNMGEKWNPANNKLKIENLVSRHAACKKVLDELNVSLALDQKKTAERQAAYDLLNPLIRRALAAAKSIEMDAASLEKATILKNLIDGTNIAQASARQKKEEKTRQTLMATEGASVPEASKNNSVSRLAFDERLENFKKFVIVFETAGNYATNEPDLTLAGLKAFTNSLKVANDATNDAWNLKNNKRAERNEVFFGVSDSMNSVIDLIKTQLIATETKKGPNYKMVVSYKFAVPAD